MSASSALGLQMPATLRNHLPSPTLMFCLRMFVHRVRAWCLKKPYGGIKCPGTGVTKGCEDAGNPTLGPLEEH